jgi:mannose-6-phosphate isomerase
VFPWLVKFLDASDWLSVQVHPDEVSVQTLWPGEGSKTEAWFILDASPGSRIYAGLLPGVGERELRQALTRGTAAECLHSFSPRPGDCLFLQAGTVHAVGGGVLLAEVQQTSDATFRLFDWNRVDATGKSRQLHIDEGLACINWQAGPVQPIQARGYPTPGVGSGQGAGVEPAREEHQHLVSCPYFDLSYERHQQPFPLGGKRLLQVLIGLHGQGLLRLPEGEQTLKRGDTILLPASLPEVWCQPQGSLGVLVATLPARG